MTRKSMLFSGVISVLNLTMVMAETILNIRKPMSYFFLRQERGYNAPNGKRNPFLSSFAQYLLSALCWVHF